MKLDRSELRRAGKCRKESKCDQRDGMTGAREAVHFYGGELYRLRAERGQLFRRGWGDLWWGSVPKQAGGASRVLSPCSDQT